MGNHQAADNADGVEPDARGLFKTSYKAVGYCVAESLQHGLSDPTGLTRTVDSMIGSGRTYYASVTWNSGSGPGNPRDKNRTGPSGM